MPWVNDTRYEQSDIDVSNLKNCYTDIEVFMPCPNCTRILKNTIIFDFPEPEKTFEIHVMCESCEESGHKYEFTMPVKVVRAEITVEIKSKRYEFEENYYNV